MFYVFDKDFLKAQTEEEKASLSKNKPDVDFDAYAAEVIINRLKADIKRYLVYGVYWWALKDVLIKQGYDILGDEADHVMANRFKGSNDSETLVAADLFYQSMSDQVMVDNRDWQIDDDLSYTLYDADMEERTALNQIADPFTTI